MPLNTDLKKIINCPAVVYLILITSAKFSLSIICVAHSGSGTSCHGWPHAPSWTIIAHEKKNPLFLVLHSPLHLSLLAVTLPWRHVVLYECGKHLGMKVRSWLCGLCVVGAALQAWYMWNITHTHASEQMRWWRRCLTTQLQGAYTPS